jgi:hypothetical protein
MKRLVLTLVTIALLGWVTPAQATPIVQYTAGTSTQTGSFFYGEAFMTPGGGPFDNITFNFFSAGTPLAAGTAYLFLGSSVTGPETPGGLSTAPGVLAASTGVNGGEYDFSDTLILQPNTEYILFEDTPLTNVNYGFLGNGSIQGDICCNIPQLPTSQFVDIVDETGISADFAVGGTPAVPEPASVLLLGTGIVTLVGRRFRRS